MSKCALTNLKAQVANFLPCLKDVKTRKHGTAFPTPDTKQHGPGGRRPVASRGRKEKLDDFMILLFACNRQQLPGGREAGKWDL